MPSNASSATDERLTSPIGRTTGRRRVGCGTVSCHPRVDVPSTSRPGALSEDGELRRRPGPYRKTGSFGGGRALPHRRDACSLDAPSQGAPPYPAGHGPQRDYWTGVRSLQHALRSGSVPDGTLGPRRPAFSKRERPSRGLKRRPTAVRRSWTNLGTEDSGNLCIVLTPCFSQGGRSFCHR